MSSILLTSGTVGITTDGVEAGDTVTVRLHDENGNPSTETGVVAEVLD